MDMDVGVIYNAMDREVSIKAAGNYFTFPKKKVKIMSRRLADWIAGHRTEEGLISLPNEFSEPEFALSPEGKQLLKERETEAIQNRINFLTRIKNNLLVSLKKDLDIANIKADPREFATPGEIAALKELAAFQAKQKDARKQRVDEITELEKLITEK